MVEKTLETEVCRACGTGVRQNALFCYHCGTSVARDAEDDARRGNLIEESNGNNRAAKIVAEDLTTENPVVKSSVETLAPLAESEQTPENEPRRAAAPIKLQTAADVRRKIKPESKSADEIIWEKPASAPNVWFLASAIVTVIFVVLVVLTMLYIH